ncbi:MAG: SCO family protein [Beijerinckiaceae bacterium]
MFKNPRLILPAVLIALSLAALAAAGYLMLRETPKQSLIGGPFALTAQDGRTVTEKDFAGRPVLVFFGYTHCPDVCPTTLFEVSEVLNALGPQAKTNAIFITVDPERDTPAVLKDYLGSFDPRVVGLSGDRAAVDAAIRAYRVYAKKIPGQNGEYTYDHTALVYLMDKNGRFVGAFNLDRKPADAAAQLREYL